jgi:hypothetical protein
LIFGVNGGTGSGSLSGGSLIADGNETVGFSTTGSFVQTGGTNSVGSSLYIGSNFGGRGTYSMTNGVLAISADLQVGYATGIGTFVQTGGAVSVGGNAIFGSASNGAAAFNLGGGTFQVTGNTSLPANGTMTISGGQFLMPGGTLAIGTDNPGAFTQSGGTVQIGTFIAGSGAGAGSATLFGGTFNATSIVLGNNGSSFGSFTQAGGTANIASDAYVGSVGNGVFTCSGGSHTISGSNGLFIGDQAGSSGTAILEGGQFVTKGHMYVGNSGLGKVQMSVSSTASVEVQKDLQIAYQAPSKGTVSVDGGQLAVRGQMSVGNAGEGTYVQRLGSHAVVTVDGDTHVGKVPGGSGTMNLDGGQLVTKGHMYVGNSGIGKVFMSVSSTASVEVQKNLQVAYQPLSKGQISVDGGVVAVRGGLFVGNGGEGTLTATKGQISVDGDAYVGVALASKGVMNISGGTHTISGTNGLTISHQVGSSGTVNVDGGVLNVPTKVIVANAGPAKLMQTAGMFNGPQKMYVGVTAPGEVIHSGGTFSVGVIKLGNAAGGSGTMTVSGNAHAIVHKFITLNDLTVDGGSFTLLNEAPLLDEDPVLNASIVGGYLRDGEMFVNGGSVTSPNIKLGLTAGFTGSYTQIGGTVVLSGGTSGLLIGFGAGSRGSCTLGGGTLTLLNAALDIGSSGTGTFVQTGGVLSVTHGVSSIGSFGNGTFTQTGGSGTTAAFYVGLFNGGVGTYSMTNGTLTVTNGLYLGLNPGAGGTVAQSGGRFVITGPEYVGYSGRGTLNQSGGTHTTSLLDIAAFAGSSGTVNLSGGVLTAGSTLINGTFKHTGGNATLGPVTGSGSASIGGAGATALASVASISLPSLTLASNGTMVILSATNRLTNSVTSLTMNGNGTLDLSNHELLANTAPATIKSYLAKAYDPTGNQDWSQPGLTSSVAKANPTSFSVAYAFGGDTSAQDAGITTRGGAPLGASQTIVRPVLTGDADMNGKVDFFDIAQILGYRYNAGGSGASYTDGDLDYSGKVDFFDIVLLLSANYNSGQTYLGAPSAPAAAAPASAPSLTGSHHAAAPASAAIASATTIGTTGDGKPDFEYDPATGHLRFRADGGTFTTTGGSASFVSSLTISSTTGIFQPGGASAAFGGGVGATLTSTLLSSALTQSPGFTDGFDIGIVLAPGLDAATLTADLTVKYQSLNGGSLKTADVTLVPEPGSLGLLALGSAASLFLGHPRRRWRAARLHVERQ